jgi:fucokinase
MHNVIAREAWKQYAAKLAGLNTSPWWNVVGITASSARQAARYRWEIGRRQSQGKLPASTRFVVVPDPDDRRVGSGGATIHALAAIAGERVLLIHSGGDSRRLPIYSVSGKLFCALPDPTPWGDVGTVFDEWMALSTLWVRDMPPGLVVGSGDVVLTFDAAQLDWSRPGVYGIAMMQQPEVGSQHGVYVVNSNGCVTAFLQKPTLEQMRDAGGLLPDGRVALDSGLIRFDPDAVARLAGLAHLVAEGGPAIDLYQHITFALTGQARDIPVELAEALRGVRFSASVVDGEFTHIGTTPLFRELMTGGRRDPLVLDCNPRVAVEAGPGSIVYGLEDVGEPFAVPTDLVVHQSPVVLPDGLQGSVIRVYGVMDDPKQTAASGRATWKNRPIFEALADLGIAPEDVWGDREQTLWNAELFPVGAMAEACARWMMSELGAFSADLWRPLTRLSLASSARYADTAAAADSYRNWVEGNWEAAAVRLAESGADVRPMLAQAPGLRSLRRVSQRLGAAAEARETEAPSEAASLHFEASLFYNQAGLEEPCLESRARAFRQVEQAVARGFASGELAVPAGVWKRREVTVSGPARLDLGGGWSDTPPFCLDWGGSVLNIAIEIGGKYPIHSSVRVIDEKVIRCRSGEDGSVEEYRSTAEVLRPSGPGDAFAIPRTVLRMMGLADLLDRGSGGLEICTEVDLPMGSGLGTSSILAATLLRAISELLGETLSDQVLSDRVMRLEQEMTSGGGWQDQAGGIFPGAKLIHSSPGFRQRLRVQPVAWTADRKTEFEEHLLLFYTGIRRVARNLLQTVVGRYLARETAAVQVLHSIKTLGAEMAYALQEGDWPYLGSLLDRHWELNQVLDPLTTNPAIDEILAGVRPFIHGAKLAGAGGGGFLMLLAKNRGCTAELRERYAGSIRPWRIARDGLRVTATEAGQYC